MPHRTPAKTDKPSDSRHAVGIDSVGGGWFNSHMRAMRCHELADDPNILQMDEVPSLVPGPDQVRVRVRAAAANFPDLLMIQGKYQLKPPLPFAPGMEIAGDVLEVGSECEGVKPGDRVLGGLRYGGYATEALVHSSSVAPLAEGVDYAHGCAYRTAYLTAYVALVRRGALQPGETLLVHGAAGGVGLAAVEAGVLLGARVIATAGSDEKLEVARKYGASEVINYSQADGSLGGFRERVKELTDGRGADVIYDPVGGTVFAESVRCIAPLGRLLVIGFAGGTIPNLPANLPLIKEFSVVGVRAGEFGRRDPKKGAENLATVDGWMSEGLIHPHICAELPLEKAGEALQMFADRRVVGKVVLRPPSAG